MKFKKTGEPKRRLANYLFFVIIIVLLVKAPIEGLKGTLEEKVLPIKEKIYTQTSSIKLGISNLKKYKQAMEENSKLKIEVGKIALLERNNSQLLEENERLRKLLSMKKRRNERLIIASVSFRDSISYHEIFHIDVGSKDGIEKNMVVLNEKTLIGRIIEVGEESSKVELLTKDGIYTSAITKNNEDLGILKGDNSEILHFDNIPIDKTLVVGEEVYTSGISDIYPKGLFIGNITAVEKGDDRLFKEVYVKQDFNIFELNEVIVLGKE